MKISILGDSITNGYLSGKTILKEKIEALAPDVFVTLKGENGDDSAGGVFRRAYIADDDTDKVIIFFGANDASTESGISSEDFSSNLRLLAEFFGTSRTILITPSYHNDDFKPDRWRSNNRILRFREQTLLLAEKEHVPCIDIYAAMVNTGAPNALLKYDGLHFSEQGYDLLAKLIVKALKN